MKPELSIVIPCLNEPKELMAQLHSQSYKNFEILLQKEKGMTAACNAGIRRARGKYIIFLEDDMRILDKDWLLKFHDGVNKHKYVVSDQVIIPSLNPAFHTTNIGIDARIAKANPFSDYRIAEDYEWYEKLRSKGYEPVFLREPIDYHYKKINPKRALQRDFYYGMYYVKIAFSYKNPAMKYSRIIKSICFDAVSAFLKFLGFVCGTILFSYRLIIKAPEYYNKK